MTESTAKPVQKEARTRELWDEARWGGFVSGGGILMAATGVLGLIVSWLSSMLYASGQPTDALGYLQLFSQHQFLASSDWMLRILADFWLIPGSIAAYLALRRTKRVVALAGTLLSLAYIVYDVNVTELSSLYIVRLSQAYVSETTDGLRAIHVAMATPAVSSLPLLTLFSFTIGAIGWFLWSLQMPGTFFGRWSAAFGVIVNVMGFLGGVGAMVQGTPYHLMGVFTVFGALFTAIWFIVIGVQLFRHGSRIQRSAVG